MPRRRKNRADDAYPPYVREEYGRFWYRPYENGKLNGTVERGNSKGQMIQRTAYVNGRKHGPDIRWNWRGRMTSHNHYKHGTQSRPPRKGKKTTKPSDKAGGMAVR